VYVPGSSLKGVMRCHAERLLTSLEVAITPTFEGAQAFRQDTPGPEAYRGTCPLGRTFGNLHVQGRLSVSDLLPGADGEDGDAQRELANQTERRNGVGIDRLLGSAKGGALFDQEVVVAGRFDGRILLRNVQLYQIALVLMVLRDLEEGYLQLGSGTSRGLGFVNAEIRRLTIETRQGRCPEGKLLGLGELGYAKDYQLFGGDSIDLPSGMAMKGKMAWDQLQVRGRDPIEELGQAVVAGPWKTFLEEARGQQWKA
jgi:CRISPR/Cas system CSM-associated protein Csm3 (group 7 of RAMP superfamily)